jgi:hypothetical protein
MVNPNVEALQKTARREATPGKPHFAVTCAFVLLALSQWR